MSLNQILNHSANSYAPSPPLIRPRSISPGPGDHVTGVYVHEHHHRGPLTYGQGLGPGTYAESNYHHSTFQPSRFHNLNYNPSPPSSAALPRLPPPDIPPYMTTMRGTRFDSSPSPPPVHRIMDDSRLSNPSTSRSDTAEPDMAPVNAKGKGSRSKFTVKDVQELLAQVIDINPFMAKHGQKEGKWTQVVELTKKNGKCVNHSQATIRKKVGDLLNYQENPNSSIGSQIAKELGSNPNAVSSLLESALHLRNTAGHLAEEKKEKEQAKIVNDRVGGEAIRRASMQVLGRRRRRERSVSTETDIENSDPSDGASRKPAKRLRRQPAIADLSSQLGEMKDILKDSVQSQVNYQKETIDIARASHEAARASQQAVIDLLRKI